MRSLPMCLTALRRSWMIQLKNSGYFTRYKIYPKYGVLANNNKMSGFYESIGDLVALIHGC